MPKLFKVIAEEYGGDEITTVERLVTGDDFFVVCMSEYADLQGYRDSKVITAIIECGTVVRHHERTIELQQRLSECSEDDAQL